MVSTKVSTKDNTKVKKPHNTGTRSRSFCFTCFNIDLKDDIVSLLKPKSKYGIIGSEVCPESGRKHLQGYVRLTNATTFNALKTKIFPANCNPHIEIAKGNDEQNFTYCSKEGDYIEWGEKAKPGRRTDLETVYNMIREKKPLEDIINENPSTYIKYHSGIDKVISKRIKKRERAPIVFWLWGLSGVGKTRLASSISKSTFIKDNTQWWCGYEGEDVILIDDFDGKWPYRDLLRLLDFLPYRGQIKGSSVNINSDVIVITCEFPPHDIYNRSDNEYQQISRRLTRVYNVTENTIETILKELWELTPHILADNRCNLTKVRCTEVEGNTSPPPLILASLVEKEKGANAPAVAVNKTTVSSRINKMIKL